MTGDSILKSFLHTDLNKFIVLLFVSLKCFQIIAKNGRLKWF